MGTATGLFPRVPSSGFQLGPWLALPTPSTAWLRALRVWGIPEGVQGPVCWAVALPSGPSSEQRRGLSLMPTQEASPAATLPNLNPGHLLRDRKRSQLGQGWFTPQ